MSRYCLGMFLVVLALSGCHSAPPPAPVVAAPPVSQQNFAEIRDSYERLNPNARVGLVKAVLPSSNLAAVGDVPVEDFKIGDIISFIDSNNKILTSGTVENTTNGLLSVHYDDPPADSRIPAVGDLAIRAIR